MLKSKQFSAIYLCIRSHMHTYLKRLIIKENRSPTLSSPSFSKTGVSPTFFKYIEHMGFVQFGNMVPVPVNKRIQILVYSYSFPNFTISWGTVCKICFHFDVSIKHKIKFIVVVDLFKEIEIKTCMKFIWQSFRYIVRC